MFFDNSHILGILRPVQWSLEALKHRLPHDFVILRIFVDWLTYIVLAAKDGCILCLPVFVMPKL